MNYINASDFARHATFLAIRALSSRSNREPVYQLQAQESGKREIKMTMVRKLIKTSALLAGLLLLGSVSAQPAEAWAFHCLVSPGGASCYFVF
jgi:hypothetical protein